MPTKSKNENRTTVQYVVLQYGFELFALELLTRRRHLLYLKRRHHKILFNSMIVSAICQSPFKVSASR